MIRFHNHSRLRKRTRNQIGLPVESRSSHAAELLLVAMRLWLELDLAAMMFLAKRCLDTKRDLLANRFADAMQLAVAMHFVLAIASVAKHCLLLPSIVLSFSQHCLLLPFDRNTCMCRALVGLCKVNGSNKGVNIGGPNEGLIGWNIN